MWRMNGADAYFLAVETPQAYMHTFKIAILDPSDAPGGWSFDRYRADALKRINVSPIFRWKYAPAPLGLNHPTWVEDPDFDLDYHLKRVSCPAPGDQKALCEFMSSIYAHQLDRSRPLWQTWVVEGLADGKVALVNLIHHAYFDGAGASYVLQQYFTAEPGIDPETPASATPTGAYPSWFTRLVWAIRDWPAVMLHYLPKAILGMIKKLRIDIDARRKGLPKHPGPGMMQKTPLNTVLGPDRTFVCDSLPLADVKQTGKHFGATINDVFLSCTAGALRRYLQEQNFKSSEPLIAGVPLSQRRPENMSGIGNFATVDYTWLHTEIEDPVERLMASHQSANQMKAHAQISQGADLGTIVALLPPWAIKFMAWSYRRRDGALGVFANVVLSNVAGPRQALWLDHTRLDNWFSTGQVFDGSSLNMTLWSYCDNANLCILADKDVLPDGWVLYDHFKTELDLLKDAMQQNCKYSPLRRRD